MFDHLVVSAKQRSKHTTAKFFLGTSALYIFAVALAFAVSVLVSDAKLADTGNVLTRVAPLPPTIGYQPKDFGPRPATNTAAPDSRNPMRLEDLLARKASAPPTIVLRDSGPNAGWGSSEGSPVIGSNIGVIDGSRNVDAPPIPADPPKPKPPTPSPAVDNRPLRISSTVLQGKAIERRTPQYPPLARQIRMPGEVSVEVIISPEGRVESTRVVSGHPMFVKAAIEAASGWRFEPTLLNGAPVRVTGVITFVFKLKD